MSKESIERRIKAKKKKLLEALNESMGIVSYACQQAGVSRDTFYRWRSEDEEFAHDCETVQENTVDKVEGKLFTAISEGNLTAIIFYLKTHGKSRGYVESMENNVNVNSFEQLLKSLPDEDDTEES